MLMLYCLILCSALVSFNTFLGDALFLSPVHPPAVWANNDFSLNRSHNPDSLVRVVLSLPISNIGHDYLGSGGQPAVVCSFFCNRIDQRDCDSFIFAALFLHSFLVSYSLSTSSYPAQVIWSANRDRPVGENATLHFSQDGNLSFRDADNTPVRSTNTAGKSVVGMRLSKEGKLELFDSRNSGGARIPSSKGP